MKPLALPTLVLALALNAVQLSCFSADLDKASPDSATAAAAETKGASRLVKPDRAQGHDAHVDTARPSSSNPKSLETFSSLDRPDNRQPKELPAGTLKFDETDLVQVLRVYQDLSHRTVLRSTSRPVMGRSERSTLTFSLRTESGSRLAGGSMATRQSSCST